MKINNIRAILCPLSVQFQNKLSQSICKLQITEDDILEVQYEGLDCL